MWPNPQFCADMVTFTEDILYGNMKWKASFFVQWKIHFSRFALTKAWKSLSVQQTFDVQKISLLRKSTIVFPKLGLYL